MEPIFSIFLHIIWFRRCRTGHTCVFLLFESVLVKNSKLPNLISLLYFSCISTANVHSISRRQTLVSKTTSWHPNNILRAVSTQWSSLRLQQSSSSLIAGDNDIGGAAGPPKYSYPEPSYLKKLKQSNVVDTPSPVDIGTGVIDYDHLERNTVIVVGLSKYTEQDGVGLIGSVHIHMPFVKVIVYDLGMRTKTQKRVRKVGLYTCESSSLQ